MNKQQFFIEQGAQVNVEYVKKSNTLIELHLYSLTVKFQYYGIFSVEIIIRLQFLSTKHDCEPQR